jgi:hypothetical protein
VEKYAGKIREGTLEAGYRALAGDRGFGNWISDFDLGNLDLVVFRIPILQKVKIPARSAPKTAGQGWGNLGIGIGDQPARRRDWVRWMVEIRDMAATIMLESSCMVATSRSSNAPGVDDRTSKTPKVRL